MAQPSPVVKQNQIAIRCDRATGDNKGGVMICVQQNIRPSHTNTFVSNNIEAVCCTLLFPNGKAIQVGLLYRSPSASLPALITVLTAMLNHVSMFDIPCVIICAQKYACAICDMPRGSSAQQLGRLKGQGLSRCCSSMTTPLWVTSP